MQLSIFRVSIPAFYRRCSSYFQFLNGSFSPYFSSRFSSSPTLPAIFHVISLVSRFIRLTGFIIAQDWLPVGIRSWTPVYIEWSRSSKAGLNFHAAYKFINDTYCGDHTMAEPEGEVNGGDLASAGLKLNQYYQQKCTWILDSTIDRQLIIEVKSTQSRKQPFYHPFSNYTSPLPHSQRLFTNFFFFFTTKSSPVTFFISAFNII